MLNAQRKFKKPEYLNQMLLLRKAGWTYKNLALLFKCDFSSIYHQCQKYNVRPVVHITITPNIIGIISQTEIRYLIPIKKDPQWYYDQFGEKINTGKSYQDYVRDTLKREKSRRKI